MSEKELNALASALRVLTPSERPFDRDAVLFQAGKNAGAAGKWPWMWPLATAASMLLALGLGITLALRPVEVRTVVGYQPMPAPPLMPKPAPDDEPPPAPSPPVVAPSASPWSLPETRYEQVVDHVYRWGLDALPPAPPTKRQPAVVSKPYPSF